MIRPWLGIAFFAVFWLLGLQYYHQTDWLAVVIANACPPILGWEATVLTVAGVLCGLLVLLGTLLLLPPKSDEPESAGAEDRDSVGAMERESVRAEEAPIGTPDPRRPLPPTFSPIYAIALVLLLPSLWVMPWPYCAAPLLIVLGLALRLLPIPCPLAKRVGSAAVMAGVILLGQALAMLAYASLTARSHELPWPLPHLLAAVARLLGADVAVDGSQLTIWSMRQVNPLAATWEWLVDPPSLCFLVGGAIFLAFRTRRPEDCRLPIADCGVDESPSPARSQTPGQILHSNTALLALARSLGVLALCVLAWLPIRAGLLIALYLHRLLRTDYDSYIDLMNQFWNPWVHLLLLVPLVLLTWRFVGLRLPAQPPEPRPQPNTEHRTPITAWASAALVCLGIAAFTVGIFWDPVGPRKAGRVLMDEHHSTWEPTQTPFDTTWYGHDSGYNYACIYDYLSRFYTIARLNPHRDETTGLPWVIDDEALANCDVLIVKVPTERYTQAEVAAIVRFVQRGGGLLLIGEHTDVFHVGTGLNDIARHFGFSFRFDCLFGVDTIFDDLFLEPLVPHPVIQNLPPYHRRAPCFDFAVSCSIAPGASHGRPVMLDWGLKNLGCDYHALNYYPQVEDRADMRYGAFIQLWATRAGAGRVVAHSDSTEFSNFCTFEPGKAELMLGMIEWLNRRNACNSTRAILHLLGLVLLAGGIFLASKELKISNFRFSIFNSPSPAFLLLIAAGVLGWSAAVVGVREAQRAAMPLPKNTSPLVQVVIDRTVCDNVLSKSGFIGGRADGFGIFERWILRLGYFISRRVDTGHEAGNDNWLARSVGRLSDLASGRRSTDPFGGDLLVFLHPNLDVSGSFVNRLARYVEEGGKVLVLDSPENFKSTANSLLYPFDLKVVRETNQAGTLTSPAGWPAAPIASANEVAGGTPLCQLNGRPVAATARYGKGLVTVVGFGSRFTDANMGVTGDVVPDPTMRKVYDFQYALLRAMIDETLP